MNYNQQKVCMWCFRDLELTTTGERCINPECPGKQQGRFVAQLDCLDAARQRIAALEAELKDSRRSARNYADWADTVICMRDAGLTRAAQILASVIGERDAWRWINQGERDSDFKTIESLIRQRDRAEAEAARLRGELEAAKKEHGVLLEAVRTIWRRIASTMMSGGGPSWETAKEYFMPEFKLWVGDLERILEQHHPDWQINTEARTGGRDTQS